VQPGPRSQWRYPERRRCLAQGQAIECDEFKYSPLTLGEMIHRQVQATAMPLGVKALIEASEIIRVE